MANRFTSTHPLTEQVLRHLGVKSSQVTQGWGSATASAGYHAPVGVAGGRKFSHCVDLSAALASRQFMLRLEEAGFVPFARTNASWAGNEHIHAIHLGLLADDGHPHLLSGPRAQIVDFLKQPPRNGLKGHSRLTTYPPPVMLQAELRKQYAAWLPDYPVSVLAPGTQQINCYAWLEGGTVTVEVEAFCRWWGKTSSIFTWGPDIIAAGGQWSFDGRFYRASVRQLAQKIGLVVDSFEWGPQKRYATVQLGYGAQ